MRSTFSPSTLRITEQQVGLPEFKQLGQSGLLGTMASGGDGKEKVNLLEDNRTDSGLESLTKDDQFMKTVRDSTSECSEARDKLASTTEERWDSAYGSSSLTVESLSEIVLDCRISPDEVKNTENSEQEENLLTTITEDGDTYVYTFYIFMLSSVKIIDLKLFAKLWCIAWQQCNRNT